MQSKTSKTGKPKEGRKRDVDAYVAIICDCLFLNGSVSMIAGGGENGEARLRCLRDHRTSRPDDDRCQVIYAFFFLAATVDRAVVIFLPQTSVSLRKCLGSLSSRPNEKFFSNLLTLTMPIFRCRCALRRSKSESHLNCFHMDSWMQEEFQNCVQIAK